MMNEIQLDASGPKKARVEIIPLIDVIFFLLATFVLFTLSLERIKVVEADLPKAGGEGPVDETTAFIQTAVDGTFYWKIGTAGPAEPITAPEIGPKLETYKRSVSIPRVLVRSDGKAKLGATVLVLDEVRRAGIKQVAIETTATRAGS